MKSWTAAAAGLALLSACQLSSARTEQRPSDAGSLPGSSPDAGQPETTGPIDADFPKPPSGPSVPLLPRLRNVVGVIDDDRVTVSFDPVDGAADYRIYPMPEAANISVD